MLCFPMLGIWYRAVKIEETLLVDGDFDAEKEAFESNPSIPLNEIESKWKQSS